MFKNYTCHSYTRQPKKMIKKTLTSACTKIMNSSNLNTICTIETSIIKKHDDFAVYY